MRGVELYARDFQMRQEKRPDLLYLLSVCPLVPEPQHFSITTTPLGNTTRT